MKGKDPLQSFPMYSYPNQTLPMFEDGISNDQCKNILQDIGNTLNQFPDIGDLDFQTNLAITGSNKTSLDTNDPSTAITLPREMSLTKDSFVFVAPSCSRRCLGHVMQIGIFWTYLVHNVKIKCVCQIICFTKTMKET